MPALLVTLALALAAIPDGGASPSPAEPARAVSAPPLLAPLKAPAPADRQYDLQRAKDGTGDLVYEAPGFTARIARDGAVRFIDRHFRPLSAWSFVPFAPSPTPAGRPSPQGLMVDLLAGRKPRRLSPVDESAAPAPPMLIPRMTPYRPDPSEVCRYPRPCYFQAGLVIVGVSGTFDLTDELMRLAGQDPYRYDKARFLAGTSQLRGGLAARAVAEDVRRALAELPAKLEELACDGSRSVRERRATLEALRQEIVADTAPARAAAATIGRFLDTRFDGDRAVRCPAH
jgi:hypothetical protein